MSATFLCLPYEPWIMLRNGAYLVTTGLEIQLGMFSHGMLPLRSAKGLYRFEVPC